MTVQMDHRMNEGVVPFVIEHKPDLAGPFYDPLHNRYHHASNAISQSQKHVQRQL